MTQHGTRLELVSGTAEQIVFLFFVVRDLFDLSVHAVPQQCRVVSATLRCSRLPCNAAI